MGQVCGTKEALRGSRDLKAPGEQAPVCEVHDSTTPFGSQNVDGRKGDLLSVIHERPEMSLCSYHVVDSGEQRSAVDNWIGKHC
jgi:hypothetical protein